MSTSRRSIAALVGVAVAVAATTAEGEVADPVEPVRELFRAFEYDEAIERAEAVAADPSVTPRQRLEAMALVGVAHLIQNRADDAREAFDRLLYLDPGHELSDPDLPPRVRQFFAERREVHGDRSVDVAANIDAPQPTTEGGPLSVTITLSGDERSADHVVLFYREGDGGPFRRVDLSRRGREFSGLLEAGDSDEPLQIYVEVRAPSGYVLARVGGADDPQVVAVGSTEPIGGGRDEGEGDGGSRRWYASWWFWTIIGVVVAGGIVAAVVTTLPEEHQDGSLGSVQMPMIVQEDLRSWR